MAQLSVEEFAEQCEAWFEKSKQLGDNWTLENSSNGQGGYIQGRHNQGGYNQGGHGVGGCGGVYLRKTGTLVVRETEDGDGGEVLDDPDLDEVVQNVLVTSEHEVLGVVSLNKLCIQSKILEKHNWNTFQVHYSLSYATPLLLARFSLPSGEPLPLRRVSFLLKVWSTM